MLHFACKKFSFVITGPAPITLKTHFHKATSGVTNQQGEHLTEDLQCFGATFLAKKKYLDSDTNYFSYSNLEGFPFHGAQSIIHNYTLQQGEEPEYL